MPVAKKTPAKSAAPALAKKVTAAKKVAAPVKKTTPAKAAPVDELEEMSKQIVGLIKSGELDAYMESLDDAVTDRLSRHLKEKEKTSAAKKSEGKTVPQPTRKEGAAKAAAVTPEVGKSYVIHEDVKVHGGKKGKFVRYYKGDTAKSLLDIGEAKPIVIPTAALKRPVTRGAVKKAAPKKVVKK